MVILESLRKFWLDVHRRFEPNTSVESDAEFVGWQSTPCGERVALYNVTVADRHLYRSTVSEGTSKREHLATPSTPIPEGQMRRLDDEKQQQ